MESTSADQFNAAMQPESERPQFLKILCILSFVACGLLILFYSLCALCLAIDSNSIEEAWSNVVESNPSFENLDPVEFFHEIGMWGLYLLILNIFSLVGAIMMWKLDKIGFFIYTVAELAANFIRLDLDIEGNDSGYGGMIFFIVIDLIFIGMYFVNLNFINKSGNSNQVTAS